MYKVYKCPKCNLELTQVNKSLKCDNNHCYDIAKRRYVNLLLVNQTHAKEPGDSKHMIEARRDFLNTHKYDVLKDKLNELIGKYNREDSTFLDLCSGDSYYTTNIAEHHPNLKMVNLDISKSAIAEGCKRSKAMKLSNMEFVIGNIDYLPFLDNSFTLMLNCFGPINVEEFDRVCKSKGIYIRVLPGEKHLFGLKKVLYGDKTYLNKEKDNELVGFKQIDKIILEDEIELNNVELNNLFTMTPYYYKSPKETTEKLLSLSRLKTPIQFEIFVYQKI